jgi:hypothetical protein
MTAVQVKAASISAAIDKRAFDRLWYVTWTYRRVGQVPLPAWMCDHMASRPHLPVQTIPGDNSPSHQELPTLTVVVYLGPLIGKDSTSPRPVWNVRPVRRRLRVGCPNLLPHVRCPVLPMLQHVT